MYWNLNMHMPWKFALGSSTDSLLQLGWWHAQPVGNVISCVINCCIWSYFVVQFLPSATARDPAHLRGGGLAASNCRSLACNQFTLSHFSVPSCSHSCLFFTQEVILCNKSRQHPAHPGHDTSRVSHWSCRGHCGGVLLHFKHAGDQLSYPNPKPHGSSWFSFNLEFIWFGSNLGEIYLIYFGYISNLCDLFRKRMRIYVRWLSHTNAIMGAVVAPLWCEWPLLCTTSHFCGLRSQPSLWVYQHTNYTIYKLMSISILSVSANCSVSVYTLFSILNVSVGLQWGASAITFGSKESV